MYISCKRKLNTVDTSANSNAVLPFDVGSGKNGLIIQHIRNLVTQTNVWLYDGMVYLLAAGSLPADSQDFALRTTKCGGPESVPVKYPYQR